VEGLKAAPIEADDRLRCRSRRRQVDRAIGSRKIRRPMVGRLTQTEAVSCAVLDDDLWTSGQRASELGGVRELDRSKFRTWLIEDDISLELAFGAVS